MKITRPKSLLLPALVIILVSVFAMVALRFLIGKGASKQSFKQFCQASNCSELSHFELLERFSEWAQNQEKPHEKPDLLLISLDTLRSDRLSSYGHHRYTSPYMDKLAGKGVRFERVFSQSPRTLPSHMTIFTGLYPSSHGAHYNKAHTSSYPLSRENGTLPRWLKSGGYRTAAWTGGGQMSAEHGFGRGFEIYKDNYLRFISTKKLIFPYKWFNEKDESPCFLFIHTYQMHSPYSVPGNYAKLFDPGYEGPIISELSALFREMSRKKINMHRAFWGKGYEQHGEDHKINPEVFSSRDIRHLKALYDANIRYTDDVLRVFISQLIREGLMDNTVLIITSDHGEEFMEHGDFLHSKLYVETLRVPLIIFYPRKLPAGKVVKSRVRLIDIAPTLLELAGISKPAQVGGVSLLKTIYKDNDSRPAFSEEPWHHDTYHKSLRCENYVLYDKGEEGGELYNTAKDPYEQDDVSSEQQQITEAMFKKLLQFEQEHEFRQPAGDEPQKQLSEEKKKELRSLGYSK